MSGVYKYYSLICQQVRFRWVFIWPMLPVKMVLVRLPGVGHLVTVLAGIGQSARKMNAFNVIYHMVARPVKLKYY